MDLKNKVVVLTGAARVGKSVAKALSAKGAHLILSYLNDPKEVEFQYPKSAVGSKILVKADLSKEDQVKDLLMEGKKAFGRIDAVVHMAAIYKKTPWRELSENDWDENMDVIGKSAFLISKIVGDEMLNNPGEPVMDGEAEIGRIKGKIITISDWSVLNNPYKDYLPYNTAKGAIIALTKSLAKELAPDILVNCIAPGPILRPDDLSEEENKEALSGTPLNRWGGAEEITKAILYLMEADFVTGQVLTVDGGRSIA